MKKTVLALVIAGAVHPLYAQADTNNNNSEETIVVTASRTQQEKFDVLAAVDVFDRESIERIQPLSVADLIRRVAGVSVTTQGTSGHQTSLFVRGSNSDHTLILVNGIKVGSATLGSKDLTSISVQLIERIEIVRGPRAALWGANAMGGVIQIFTRSFEAGEGQVGVKLGTDKLRQGYGAIGFGTDNHQYTLSASAESSDGYDVIEPAPNSFTVNQPDDDGYSRESIVISGTSKFSDTYSLELNGQYDQGNTEIDSSFLGDETDYENYHLLARNHIQMDDIYLQVSAAKSRDHSEDNLAIANRYSTQRTHLSALAQIPLSENTEIVSGFDWYQDEIDSSATFINKKRNEKAIYITARHTIDSLKLEGSVRRDDVEQIDEETTYQLAAGYHITNNFLVAVTHGTAFQAPSFNELYTPFGNPELEPETAKNSEVLSRYKNDNFSVELALFHADYDNLIIWEPNDDGVWQPLNVSPVIKGAEATINTTLFGLDNSLTISHIDAENDQNNKQLLRRSYVTANYNVSYQGNNWDIGLNVNLQGGRYDVAGSQRIRLGSHTLVDINASYQVTDNLSLLAKITNIGDKEYQQSHEYPGADRGAHITLDYRF